MSYQIFLLPTLTLKHLISCVFRGPDSIHRSQSLYTCRSAFHIPAWSKWTHVLVPSMMDDLFKRFLDDHLLKGQLLKYFLDGEVSMPSLPPNRRRIWLNLMASSTEMPLKNTQHLLHFTRQKAGTHVVASGSCSPIVPQCNNFWGLHSNLPSKNDGTKLPIMINIMQIFPDSQSNCLNKVWNIFVYHLCRSTNPLQQETRFTTMGSRQQQQMFVLRRDFRCSTEDPKIWTIWVTNDRLSLGKSNVGHKKKVK